MQEKVKVVILVNGMFLKGLVAELPGEGDALYKQEDASHLWEMYRDPLYWPDKNFVLVHADFQKFSFRAGVRGTKFGIEVEESIGTRYRCKCGTSFLPVDGKPEAVCCICGQKFEKIKDLPQIIGLKGK